MACYSVAQLVEYCTGIAEVMGSNPIQAWIFFRPYFHYFSSIVHYCKDCFHIHVICSIYLFLTHYCTTNCKLLLRYTCIVNVRTNFAFLRERFHSCRSFSKLHAGTVLMGASFHFFTGLFKGYFLHISLCLNYTWWNLECPLRMLVLESQGYLQVKSLR